MATLVDDQELSRLLRSNECFTEPMFTTGLWYVRLCQAVLHQRGGALSGPILALPAARRERALRAVIALPEPYQILNMRELGPRVAQLRLRHRLNLLSAEALAAAIHLDAEVRLTVRAPTLEAAMADHGCVVRRLYD